MDTPIKIIILKRRRTPTSIKLLALLFIIFTAIHTTPMATVLASAQEGDDDFPDISGEDESADYGIYNKMDLLTEEMDSHINSPEILQETKSEINAMVEEELLTHSRIPGSYQVLNTGISDPRKMTPLIFDDIYENPMINNTEVLDWVLPQPLTNEGILNYWAVTKYRDEQNNTLTSWGQGSLRPTVFFPHFSLDKWLYLDIDHNAATGNGGADMRMRLSFVWENLVVQRPTVLPQPNSGSLSFRGGILVEAESYGSLNRPVDINIIKGFSYDNNNYIFTVTIQLNKPPTRMELFLGSEKIEIGNVDIFQFLANMTQGLQGASISDISGPYTFTYQTDDEYPYLNGAIGVIKLLEKEMVDKGWLKISLNKAQGYDHIPRDGRLWLNSENFYSPLDILIWSAGEKTGTENKIPVVFTLEYCEEQENLTYAKAQLSDLPAFLNVTMDYSQEKRGKNLTIIDYTASDVVDTMTFNTYQFPRTPDGGFDMDIYISTNLKVRHIPKRWHIEVTSDLGHQFDFTIYNNPTYSLMGNLIDNVIGRVAGRFYRLGIILRSLPENMMTLPSRQGWLIMDAYDDYFGELEYAFTSGKYIYNPDRNYLGFYRDHSIDQYLDTYPLVDFAISGHIKNIIKVTADFDHKTVVELTCFGHEPLDAITLDENDYVFIEISNLPDQLKLQIKENQIFYETPTLGHHDPLNNIKSITLFSDVGGNFMYLNILNMPGNFSLGKVGDRLLIDTGDEFIDMVEFAITDKSGTAIRQLKDGNYVYMYQDKDHAFASGRIFGLQTLDYSTGGDGSVYLKIKEESVMRFKIVDKLESDLDIQLILTPFPTEFSMQLPNIVNSSVIRFPDIVNITGIVDYGNMMFSLGEMGLKIMEIMGNVSTNIVNSIGGIGTDFTFSYNLNDYDSTMDLIAILKKGDWESLGPVDWTHGICMNQRVNGDELDFYGNIYLQGLPSAAEISLRINQDQLKVDLEWENYNPKYPWLILNTKGLQNQDVILFLSGIQPNINLDIHVDMYTTMEIGGRMSGDIKLRFTDRDGDLVNLDQMYVRFRKYGKITSIREAYLPNLPGILEATFSMEEDIIVEYNASVPIEYLFFKLSKSLGGRWSNVLGIFHDLPEHFSMVMTQNYNFSINEPLPIQNLPNFEVKTYGSNTLDMFLSVDGAGFGQRGKYLVYLRDVGDNTRGKLISSDEYEFRSDGVGYMDLTVYNLHMMDLFRLDSLSVRGQDLRSFTVSVYMLYGVYPVFQIKDVDGTALQVELHNTVFLLGREIAISVMIMDIAFRQLGPFQLATEMPMATDRFSVDMEKHPRHIIIGMPLVTTTTISQI